MATSISEIIQAVQDSARPLSGTDAEFDHILDVIGDKRFVLIGEASHGTHEFYSIRAQITERLIEEKGFTAVIVEADWPDAYRVNRYVRGAGEDKSAAAALTGFKRFPTWMWRNRDVVEFVEWLRARNLALSRAQSKAGFYGMDLYSLYNSIEEVLTYLDRVDPQAARRARDRYACFERFDDDPQSYGYAAGFDLEASCEEHVISQLSDLVRQAPRYSTMDGQVAEDEYFFAEQNARLVRNAEEYYRSMFRGHVDSWNLRDQHMVETIEELMTYLNRRGGRNKAVVWAHNSHLGDARFTEMGERGEWNVGQLMRDRFGFHDVFNIGFTTHAGTVTAASDWGSDVELKRVVPSLHGSVERLFHECGIPRFSLIFDEHPKLREMLSEPMLERAIGVIYLPRTERMSHYFNARISKQFDAVIHVDQSRALEPLDRSAMWIPHEEPETYPTGL
jgi:erythromycin esterase-like protein